MNRRKMVAYLRQNIPKYGLQAVKDDLIRRQLHAPIEVEAACQEALKPEDPLRQVKIGLAAAGVVCLLATAAMWVFWIRPPAAPPAPSPDMPMPAVRPALAVAPASDPEAAAKSLEAGRAAFKSAQLEEALAGFDEALRLDPLSVPARAERGAARLHLYRRMMNPLPKPGTAKAAQELLKGAKQDLRDCAAADPELARETVRALALDEAQWIRREQGAGRRVNDIAFLNAVLEFAGDDPQVFREAASAVLSLDEPQKALTLLDRALAVEPGYVEAHLDRASVLNALGRPKEALAALAAAEKLDPGRPEIPRLRQLIRAGSQ